LNCAITSYQGGLPACSRWFENLMVCLIITPNFKKVSQSARCWQIPPAMGEIHTGLRSTTYSELFTATRQVAPLNRAPGDKSVIVDCLVLRVFFSQTSTTPQPVYGSFSGTTRVSRCQKGTSGLYGEGKINRGRHRNHPDACHSIWTNQCPLPPSPHLSQAGCPSCRPTNSVKAPKDDDDDDVHFFPQNATAKPSYW